jgi:hypothetical protein
MKKSMRRKIDDSNRSQTSTTQTFVPTPEEAAMGGVYELYLKRSDATETKEILMNNYIHSQECKRVWKRRL